MTPRSPVFQSARYFFVPNSVIQLTTTFRVVNTSSTPPKSDEKSCALHELASNFYFSAQAVHAEHSVSGVGLSLFNRFMKKAVPIFLTCTLLSISIGAFADDAPKTPEDLARDAAIAEFTKKMEAANYPALFEKAAKEFNVPVEILKGVSFAETRWEHFIWPEGETVSPENGMPRPYGIMSLWDNEFFGHSLNDAAKLIGKTPEDLKKDPLDNMRGAAALLKQLYDKTPKPKDSTEGELESWRNAIAEYSGIPEPDLKTQHAFDVYQHLSEGYNQYGIKFEKVPNLKLDQMYAEVKKLKEEARIKREAKYNEQDRDAAGLGPVIREDASSTPSTRLANAALGKSESTNSLTLKDNSLSLATSSSSAKNKALLAVLAIAAVVMIFFLSRKKNPSVKKPN